MDKEESLYSKVISGIFASKHQQGLSKLKFTREELVDCAEDLGLPRPKNIGDILYSFRFRQALPRDILSTAPEGKEWAIFLDGVGQYEFRLVRTTRIVPTVGHLITKIPDATPEIVSALSIGDEQAVLTRIRYNRLLDIFLGIAAYSLQNHLRTTAPDIGQVEIDEIYAGIDRYGIQYVVPVQAKGGNDQLGVVQARQDLAVCAAKYPTLIARPVAAQFIAGSGTIVLFELAEDGDDVVIVQEEHYQLVSSESITDADRINYSRRRGFTR